MSAVGERGGRARSTATAWPPSCRGEPFGGGQRAAGDGDLADALRPQVHAGELGHLAGAEDQDAQAGQVAEDLAAPAQSPRS